MACTDFVILCNQAGFCRVTVVTSAMIVSCNVDWLIASQLCWAVLDAVLPNNLGSANCMLNKLSTALVVNTKHSH